MDKTHSHALPGRDAITVAQMRPHSSCLEQLRTGTVFFITVALEDTGKDTLVSPLPSPAV